MIVKLIKRTKIYNFVLPKTVSGNFWITDIDGLGNSRNLVNIEESDGLWHLKSNFDVKIVASNKEVDSVPLKEHSLHLLRVNNDNDYILLYCLPDVEDVIRLKVNDNSKFLIGNNSDAAINYSYPLVSSRHAVLTYQNKIWYIEDLNSNYGTYVNNKLIKGKKLYHGDIIFIMGLKIIVLGDSIIVNRIGNLVKIDDRLFSIKKVPIQPIIDEANIEEENIEFYKDEDYFFRSPRFKAGLDDVEINIDAPPSKITQDDTPFLYVIGPMLSMGMVSLMMGYSTVESVINGDKDLKTSLPSIIMCVAMLLSMILWPLLNRRYQRKKSIQKENVRQERYKEYISEKRSAIYNEMEQEKKVLIDNYIPLNECADIILNRKRNLWEREIDQSDFLDLRLGIGSTSFKGKVRYPQESFSLEDDNLRELVLELGKESKELEQVPINLSFATNNIAAIIGDGKQKNAFIDGLMLQLMTFHSYNDLKIVIFTNNKKESRWDYMKTSPYIFNNSRTVRYFATNNDDAKELSLNLEQVFQSRVGRNDELLAENNNDYKNYTPYYFIVIDDFKAVRELEIIKDICRTNINVGFSLVIINNRLVNLPNECHTFISIGDVKSGVFENELVSNKQKEFIADFNTNIDMYQCVKTLANIPIEANEEAQSLPNMVSFLEMYNVGKVEQLNILDRWRDSNPTKSLQAPIGVSTNRELFKLDVHEKAHGPHGLIAGMTGSGKSELIITYVLSLAINYSPNEVNFILLDYKGGGLTGAFENKETGIKLPHLAGTITNLDTVEMNRSLASIQSELRRRQKKFNEVRDNLNESTIDIYKYQNLFREGLVDEAIPHLLIISDEFAELKDSQPDFMDELISTARIGRSLGVHLILATQKPAGVVNDQIWSNSKFRVCLKVQDKTDSMDMIKCPDAASIKETGRFYLQVGYNELFALGQSAFSGAKYYPQEKSKEKIDERIDFIDNVGNVVRSIDSTNRKVNLQAQGEQVTSIVRYIVDSAREVNLRARQLWLNTIPAYISVSELRKKYGYVSVNYDINPVIGEYDDPNNQRQGLLTLSLSSGGNAIIYGSAGTGKELTLSTMIYSTIIDHGPNEVNFYILDFGAEVLRIFKNAPQVGDVVLQSETEKVQNLFKLLMSEVENRKKIFANYNGDYNFYLKHSGKALPLIVVVISNYDAYSESFPEYDEVFSTLTREGNKYGIVFVVTASTTNSLRYRVRQNFAQNIVLQFNDQSDYATILGNTSKKYPSKIYGRGLVNLDDTYEIQIAHSYTSDKMNEYLKTISSKLSEIFNVRARPIPILPEVVTHEVVQNALNNLETIPVGIDRDTLQIRTLNCNKNYLSLVTSNDISEYPSFINNLVKTFTFVNDRKVAVFDTFDIVDDTSNALVIKNDFSNNINSLISNSDSMSVIIVGLDNLLNSLDQEEKDNFTSYLALNTHDKRFVIIDNVEKIKNLSFEAFLKDNLDFSTGVFLGSGITDQFVIKLQSTPRSLREELPMGFGVIVVKGKASIIKLLGDDNNGQ